MLPPSCMLALTATNEDPKEPPLVNLAETDQANSAVARPQASKGDIQTLRDASSTIATELSLASLAIERSLNPEVRNFAKTTLQDDTKIQQQLGQLAKQQKVTLSLKPDAEGVRQRSALAAATGVKFDMAYVQGRLSNLRSLLSVVQDAANGSNDPELRGWAAQVAPVLKRQIQSAQQLDDMLRGTAP